MDTINQIYSFLCSQNISRSFVICDHVLPFCQRCTGLYLAMGLSFIYLIATGHFKKGVPTRSILCVNIVGIGIMVVFGFHILDPGSRWRLWSGLIYGNSLIYLLFPSVWQFSTDAAPGDYSKSSILAFFAFFAILNTIALWFPFQSEFFWVLTNIIALTGLLAPIFCVLVLLSCILKKMTCFFILKGVTNE